MKKEITMKNKYYVLRCKVLDTEHDILNETEIQLDKKPTSKKKCLLMLTKASSIYIYLDILGITEVVEHHSMPTEKFLELSEIDNVNEMEVTINE